jgi:hypothetical protein
MPTAPDDEHQRTEIFMRDLFFTIFAAILLALAHSEEAVAESVYLECGETEGVERLLIDYDKRTVTVWQEARGPWTYRAEFASNTITWQMTSCRNHSCTVTDILDKTTLRKRQVSTNHPGQNSWMSCRKESQPIQQIR